MSNIIYGIMTFDDGGLYENVSQHIHTFLTPLLGHHAVEYWIEGALQGVQHVREKLKKSKVRGFFVTINQKPRGLVYEISHFQRYFWMWSMRFPISQRNF